MSLAGRVNEGVGRLLGYSGRQERGGVGEAMAAITGYETLAGEKEKYTVYKLRIALPDSVPRTWFIHRFTQLISFLNPSVLQTSYYVNHQTAFLSAFITFHNFSPHTFCPPVLFSSLPPQTLL